jgi:hypothetical protein
MRAGSLTLRLGKILPLTLAAAAFMSCGDLATEQGDPPILLQRVSGDGAVGFVGTLVDTVAVRAVDRVGNPRPGLTVEWSISEGGGSIRVLGTDGLAVSRAIWTLGPLPGRNALTVRLGAVTQTFTATAVDQGFGVRQLAVGGGFTCALALNHGAYCWGDNEQAQLGVATSRRDQRSPLRVAPSLTFSSIVAGTLHTCALTPAGDAYCWGANYAGQRGFLGRDDVPRRVAAPPFVQIAAGAHHTCGLTRDGVVLCWGDNTLGQIGTGSDRSAVATYGSTAYTTPTAIKSALRFVSLAASWSATCAVATTGDTYCWGNNSERELGAEIATTCRVAGDYHDPGEYDAPCSTVPVRLDIPIRLTTLVSNAFEWCGISTDAALWCWGGGLTRPRIARPGRFASAWLFEHFVCATETASLALTCWGHWDDSGQLRTPPFGNDLELVELSSSGSHSCGIARRTSVAYCWGVNERGELGNGSTAYGRSPSQVLPAPNN